MARVNKLFVGLSALLIGSTSAAYDLETRIKQGNSSSVSHIQDFSAIQGIRITLQDSGNDTISTGPPDEPEPEEKEPNTWELHNDLLPKYSGDRRIFLGRANEDSLYNKTIRIGDW